MLFYELWAQIPKTVCMVVVMVGDDRYWRAKRTRQNKQKRMKRAERKK